MFTNFTSRFVTIPPCSLSWTNCDGSPGEDFVSDGAGGSVCARFETFGIGNGGYYQDASC